jgi:altronate dehydratase
MTINHDKLGFDVVKAKKSPKSKIKKIFDISDSEKSLVFSKKIIAALEDKLKYHNKNNRKKLKLTDLKKAYKAGFNEAKDLNKETLAHVNFFLRISSNGSNVFKSEKFEIIGSNFFIKAEAAPEACDYSLAEEDIKKYSLEDFNFKNHEELYLEDENDNITIYGLKNL